MVTFHHTIVVYNDMFDYMHGVMQALARNKTELKEDMIFAVKFACQKLSKYHAAVTPTMGMLHDQRISSILSGSCHDPRSGTRE